MADDQYRIRDVALEMLVQPGKRTKESPMLLVELPFDTSQTETLLPLTETWLRNSLTMQCNVWLQKQKSQNDIYRFGDLAIRWNAANHGK